MGLTTRSRLPVRAAWLEGRDRSQADVDGLIVIEQLVMETPPQRS